MSATTQHTPDEIAQADDDNHDRLAAYSHISNMATVDTDSVSGDTIHVNGDEHTIAVTDSDKRPNHEEYLIVLENYNLIKLTVYPPIEGKSAYHLTYEYHENTSDGEHVEERNLATLTINGNRYNIDSQPNRDIQQNTLARYAD